MSLDKCSVVHKYEVAVHTNFDLSQFSNVLALCGRRPSDHHFSCLEVMHKSSESGTFNNISKDAQISVLKTIESRIMEAERQPRKCRRTCLGD